MLNPLTKHEPSPIDDLPGDGNDFESPVSSPDATGYIGKKKNIHFLKILSVFFIFNYIEC